MFEIVGAIKTKIIGQSKYKDTIEMLIAGAIVFIYSFSIGLQYDIFKTNL